MAEIEKIKDIAIKKMAEAVNLCMEHVDSVQIIATIFDGDRTEILHKAGGNHYARVGSVRDWLQLQDVETREFKACDVRKEVENEGEDWRNG